MFSNEELITIHKSLDDCIMDYDAMMNDSKIVPLIFKIEDILTNRGVFIDSACDS